MTGRMTEPVAIVGMDVLLPGADSVESYWNNLVNGVDAISDVPSSRWDPQHYDPGHSDHPSRFYCRRGGFIDDIAWFDPMRFGVMPASVRWTEPEQLLALRVASTALEDAGGIDRLPDRDRVAVILGRLGQSSMAGINFYPRVYLADQLCRLIGEMLPELHGGRLDGLRRAIDDMLGPYPPENVMGLMPNFTASRVANRLDLHGPAYILDAACASSLIAVDHGIAGLMSGQLDMAVVGGVHHNHDATFWSVFTQLGAMSRRQISSPFDAAADGLLIGEATAMVVLKRLSDALGDGDRVHAVIRGIGVSSDGRTSSLVNPETAGQVLAIRRAWESAGLDPAAPDSIGMLEAHGTATPVGDAAELETLATVFGPRRGAVPAVIGSVKSMIGHTMPAAGAAALIKAVLAVSRGMLLPTLHCEDPRPEMASTRFAPLSQARPWEGDEPRRAAVNAFGFGGINAHVIVEQAPEAVRSRRRPGKPAATASARVAEPERILLLSGPDPASIARLLDTDDRDIPARGAHAGADAGADDACRLGIVGPTASKLAAARKIVAAGAAWRGGRDIWFSPRPLLGAGQGKIAFIFPGLEAELSAHDDDIIAHFGLDSAKTGSDDFSGRFTEVLRLGLLLHEALGRIGVAPDAIAGHSLGEWTAGLVAGLTDETSLGEWTTVLFNPTIERKDLLHAVVGDSAEAVCARLPRYRGVVLTHDNAPAQSVVCGPVGPVTSLIDDLGTEGKLCRPLPFTTGVHTPYMAPFVEQLRSLIADRDTRHGTVPVWSATIAAPLPADLTERRELFFRHLTEPVRFRSTLRAMHQAGFRVFLQVGPGQLASLIQDNLRDHEHLTIPANVAVRDGLAQLRRVATAIWAEGGTPDLAALEPAARPEHAAATPDAVRDMRRLLDLGTRRLSLGERARGLITAPRSGPAAVADEPVAAQFADLLKETEDAATAVLSTIARQRGTVVADRPASAPANGGGDGHAAPQVVRESALRISLDEMPYLADHSFHEVPEGWPDMEDAMPVMPAMTIVAQLADAVEAAVPGSRVVAVNDARFVKWTLVVPEQTVKITVKRVAPDVYDATFGSTARMRMRVAPGYPAAPAPWREDPAAAQPSPLTAERMYSRRLMFHGPRYRGVTAIHTVSDQHVRGELRAPEPPGALLDSGLQIIGGWAHTMLPERKVLFPMGFSSIGFFGPPPATGERLECAVRFHTIRDSDVLCDIQYVHRGKVWVQIGNAVSRRFDSHPRSRKVELDPGHHAFAVRQPEGWVAVFDDWPDPTTLNSMATLVLGAESYHTDWEPMPVPRRKGWLLSRLAVKDAVRYQMWADGGPRPIFPVEINVTDGPGDRPLAHGWERLTVPGYRISSASARHLGVAIARPPASDGRGVGIGVAEIGGGTGPREAAAAAAIQAAAAAAGEASPAEATVTGATATTVTVAVSGRTYQISHREVLDPYEDSPSRRHVVAWTADHGDDRTPQQGRTSA
jgi:acyl transferase domain-containing protein